mmetsp:Transcript_34874/g.54509  ORF Transcript_34874/g.54509 Transcript_34874/m.54509 type:complete len:86 (+) Transcript_34874:196-453(+)
MELRLVLISDQISGLVSYCSGVSSGVTQRRAVVVGVQDGNSCLSKRVHILEMFVVILNSSFVQVQQISLHSSPLHSQALRPVCCR